ncbi:MAG: NAD(P)-dependent alcohol dehydrogenase, partial [Candidatus Kariarchaeaceae archaeon]
MKIAHLQRYGTPDDVEIVEIPLPVVSGKAVLVKIKAASLNATDIEIIRGDPIIRLFTGMRKPKKKELGCDLSGIVEQIGSQVTQFSVGDEVFMDVMYHPTAYGAFAEYKLVTEDWIRKKPEELSFEEAATIGQAGVLALQGIIEPDPPTQGSKVLINGAGGSVGSFAIQIAKHHGAEVTGVDHPDKFDFLRSLGADHCISYLDEDFTTSGKYDIILDCIARKSVREYRRALNPGGRYRMVGGYLRKIFGMALWGTLTSKLSDKDVGLLLGRPNDRKLMEELASLHS